MGKLVVTEFVSVDGVFEDPGGSEDYQYGGWTFEYDQGEEGDRFKLEELMAAEAQLFGRVTYEACAAAWPAREGAFADKIQPRPQVRGLEHAHGPDLAEHDGDLRRGRRRTDRAVDTGDRRDDPGRRQRNAGALTRSDRVGPDGVQVLVYERPA